ncbi:MAG: hypothetical protein JRJ77_12145 [Deltaproteobacteria bacterium]|nr:hypothetical protein [Deltaproteobacteria bacterium]MBW2105505.1 hypothetical protein [Deltaproteobacteria bacterium]
MSKYQPYGKTKLILDKAMAHIESVPYQVSLRWVFYRLLQDGFYNKKADYDKFATLTSRARKNWYDGWNPETLSDETRNMDIFYNDGERPDPDIDELIEQEINEAEDTLEYYKDQLSNYRHNFFYEIDPNYYQANFLLIMFEARAMAEQFKAYTHGLTLCPFGGQPSIPYKWQVAKYLEEQCFKYEKSGVVLYFGDLDEAGLKIFEAGKRDIVDWCRADLNFIRCGLTEEHVAKFKIPENPEHPGYQWEALTDEQAKEIIQSNLKDYYDLNATKKAEQEAELISEKINWAVNESLR